MDSICHTEYFIRIYNLHFVPFPHANFRYRANYVSNCISSVTLLAAGCLSGVGWQTSHLHKDRLRRYDIVWNPVLVTEHYFRYVTVIDSMESSLGQRWFLWISTRDTNSNSKAQTQIEIKYDRFLFHCYVFGLFEVGNDKFFCNKISTWTDP